MKRYSIGIIGYGGFGRFLHEAWSKLDRAVVVALADSDPRRDPGGTRLYSDWREMLNDDHVDVVAIATPPSTHAEIACAALEKGKHVLVEKPVATTLEDAARIRESRDQYGRVATVDFMLRFNPVVETLRHWRQSECFGRLRRVAVENYAQDESLPPEHWFWDRSVSGGILVEHAVHFFDLVQWCSGSAPIRVDGVAAERDQGQEDRMMATVVHEDGVMATHYHAFSGPDFFERTSMRFVFDLLKIDVHGWIPMSGSVSAITNRDTERELSRLPGFSVVSRTELSELVRSSDTSVGGRERLVRAAGNAFSRSHSVQGEFSLPMAKSDAYQEALRDLMTDFVAAVSDPGHSLRVTLEHGIASLELALRASADGRARRS